MCYLGIYILFCFLGETSEGAENCSDEQFQCGANGKCIPKRWQCDYHKDCVNGEDEYDCRKFFPVFLFVLKKPTAAAAAPPRGNGSSRKWAQFWAGIKSCCK